MKVESTKEKLQSAVSKAERITGKNLTLPVLASLILEAKNNSLTIKATNLDIGVEITMPVKVIEEGTVAVPGNVLGGFLSNLHTDKNILLETVKGNLRITGGKTSITLKALPHDDFPTIPKVMDGTSFNVDIEEFLRGLTSVSYSASNSTMKPELASVYIYHDDEGLVFVATDSFRLAEKRVKTKKMKDFGTILLPFKNAAEVLRVFEGVRGELAIDVNKNQISFTSADGIYLTSRVVDGTFPDYKQIIPKKSTTGVILLREDFVNALKISNVFSDAFRQINIRVDVPGKSFQMKTKNADVGESTTELDAALSGESIEINFNYKYIMDCFQSISPDSISLEFSALNRPMVIRGVGDKSFTYLVMPMNK